MVVSTEVQRKKDNEKKRVLELREQGLILAKIAG